MKLKALFMTAFLFSFGSAQAAFMMGPPQEVKQEVFATVVENVDETTATSLTTKQEEVQSMMTEFKSLMEAEERDQTAIDTLREQIKTARDELRSEIKTVLDENDELKDTVKAQVREAHQSRHTMRYSMHNEEAFNQVVEAANESQASTLEANRTQMETLREDMKTARESGVSRETMSELREQMMALRDEQKAIVEEVLDNNSELKQSLVEEAKANRPQRPGGLEGKPRPPRGDGMGRPGGHGPRTMDQ